MRRKQIVIAAALLGAISIAAGADRLSIGQVDTGRLLIGQRVDLYVSVDVAAGASPTADDFRIFESADSVDFQEVDAILEIVPVRDIDAPLSFYMLVDNSGSMYDETVEGTDLKRIDAARQAIRDFANSITNERDQIGIGVFNTRYRQLGAPSRDKAGLGSVLLMIEEPAREEGYTELYAALTAAATDARGTGRRTVIVLSDGENYPYSVYENQDHPEYGDRLYSSDDAIDSFHREGLSVFAIHYGDREDPNLDRIAEATGGAVYRATGPDELAQVYKSIRTALLAEYRISYRATMIPAERRIVRVTYQGAQTTMRSDRVYFANTLFAGAGQVGLTLMIVLFAIGLIALGVLLMLSIHAGSSSTSLVVLDSGGASGLQKTIALGPTETVIGASPDANVTIAGNPAISERHAVVTYEPKKSEYTIVSDSPVKVNNQPTTRRTLKPGDVINVEGTIFAYDESDT